MTFACISRSNFSAVNGPDAMWSIGNSGYKTGKFYAKAKRSEGCAAGRSKTIKL